LAATIFRFALISGRVRVHPWSGETWRHRRDCQHAPTVSCPAPRAAGAWMRRC